MKKLLILLSLFGITFTACDGFEELGGGANPKIELSQQNIEIECESNEYSISVTAPYSWRAISHNEWIIISTKTGIAGTKELKFSVTRNEEMEIREGTIVVRNEDFDLAAELYITQKAFEPTITIEPEKCEFLC